MSSQGKEAEGITAVPDPPAPEEEEAAPAEAGPEEGEEEGEEPKPDAAAEEKLPAAAKNPDEFPQKDGVIIELSALPGVSTSRGIYLLPKTPILQNHLVLQHELGLVLRSMSKQIVCEQSS